MMFGAKTRLKLRMGGGGGLCDWFYQKIIIHKRAGRPKEIWTFLISLTGTRKCLYSCWQFERVCEPGETEQMLILPEKHQHSVNHLLKLMPVYFWTHSLGLAGILCSIGFTKCIRPNPGFPAAAQPGVIELSREFVPIVCVMLKHLIRFLFNLCTSGTRAQILYTYRDGLTCKTRAKNIQCA